MKIAVLIGSLRKKSYNRMLFNTYASIAQEAGVDFIEIRYDDFPLYSEDIQTQGFPSSVESQTEKLRLADAVLFVSPEYNYSIPGALKNAIDWFSRTPNQPFAGKPAAIMGASPGKLGTARMQYQLRQIGVFLDIKFLNKPEIMVSEVHKLFDENGQLKDETTKKFLATHCKIFVEYALSNSTKK